MKITAIILLIGCLQVGASGSAQTITLSEREAPLEKIFQEIKKQSGYTFVYRDEWMQMAKKVNIELRNASIEEALEASFAKQPLTYELVERTVVVKLKKEKRKNYNENSRLPPIDVRGRIVNEKGEPVISSVIVKGTGKGTITNSDGYFELKEIDENAILVISAVNIYSKDISIAGNPNLKAGTGTPAIIVVEMKIIEGEEVKIISGGYYTVEDKRRTGNIAKINSKDIEKQPVTSPLLSLQGRVAGLEITPVIGTPGSAPVIKIRGKNSLRHDGNYPLYVVDGVPVLSSHLITRSGTLMSGGFDPLGALNPADIESIEVLKDADATAIYGSRGANGVILIKTKSASKSEGTNIDFSIYRGLGEISTRMDVLNAKQYLEMRREAFNNDGQTPSFTKWDLMYWDTTRSTDWQDVFYGNTANITDVQTYVSGKAGNTSFRFGGGVHKESLVLPGDLGYKRAAGQINVNHISANNRFNASVTVNYGKVDHDIIDDGYLVNSALTLPPVAPKLYNEDGSLNWELFELNGNYYGTWQNPLTSLLKTHEATNKNLGINGRINYSIHKNISFSTNIGLTELNGNEFIKNPTTYYAPQDRPYFKGNAFFGKNARNSWIVEPQINYSETVGKHKLSAIVGATWQVSEYEHQLIEGSNYVSDALLNSIRGANTITFLSDDYGIYKFNSGFGRIGYSFQDKYLINLTGRRDGSSRFGPDRKFGNFGAVGLGWVFSNEEFIDKMLPFISFGKIRVSYGNTGNDQIKDYGYYDRYNIYTNQYQNTINLVPAGLFSPDFGWEDTRKFESAIALSFFKDILSLEVAWFKNKSSNQLVNYQLPATTGFPSVLSNFDATVENSGYEILLGTQYINSKSLQWTSSFNISLLRNKLIEFPEIENSPYAKTYKVGEPLSILRLYKWKGVNKQTGVHEFEDINGDGFINDDDKVFMDPLKRKYYGGLNNRIIFKGIELSFLMQFSNQRSTKYMPGLPGTNINQPQYITDRWQKPGDQSDVQRYNQSLSLSTAYFNLRQSDYNVENSSFIRLKTLSLVYHLPKTLINKVKMEKANVFIQGHNLLTITKFNQLDPETGISLPPLRVISFGLQFQY